MNRLGLSFFVLFFFFFFTSIIGAQNLILDVKTQLPEKAGLAAIKIGTDYFLQAEGFRILDIGEDYAVWLGGKKVVSSITGKVITLSVRITRPSAFLAGPTLAEAIVSFEVPAQRVKAITLDLTIPQILREKLSKDGEAAMQEANFGGRAVAEKIRGLLAGLPNQ